MSSLMHQGRATYAFFERNWNLTRRYWAWEAVWLIYNLVNAMSVTYIGVGSHVPNFVLYLVIGTAVWTYLGVGKEPSSTRLWHQSRASRTWLEAVSMQSHTVCFLPFYS